MNHRLNLLFLANALLISATVIWGATFFIIHDNLNGINAVTLTAYRFLLAAVPLCIYLLLTGRNIFAHACSGCLLGILLAIFYLTQTLGLIYTTASNSGFITSLIIVFIPIFNFVFWRKIPALEQFVAIGLSLLGLWLIASDNGQLTLNIGDLLTIVAACAGSLQIIMIDKCLQKNMDPWVLNFQQCAITGIISLIGAFMFHASFHIYTMQAFFSLIYLAFAASLAAYSMLFFAQKHIAPTNVAVILMLEPVFAALFAWTLGSEIFAMRQAIGGLCIIGAALCIIVFENKSDDGGNEKRRVNDVSNINNGNINSAHTHENNAKK